MARIVLSVSATCGDRIMTRGDGRVLFDRIASALRGEGEVEVDFEGREIASESFLDEAIVEHYMHPVAGDPGTRLKLHRVAPGDQALLRMVYRYRKDLERRRAKSRRAA